MVGAMAENSILQIVVFSLFVGIALTAIGERGKPIVTVIEAMVELMLQVTGYRSEEHTSELQSLMRISYAVFCLKKKKNKERIDIDSTQQNDRCVTQRKPQ